MKTARLILITGLCLGTSGCLFSKKTAAVVPSTPPAPKPAADQPPFQRPLPPLPVATAIPEPPPPPQLPEVQNPEAATLPVPTPPPPRQTVRRKPSPMPPPAAAPVPSNAGTAPAAAPELREIISGEQRRRYEAEFSQDMERASAVLKQAAVRSLSAEQQETAARIRTFLAQAASARDNDISTALQLARRAELLGQELLKSMK